MAIFAGIPSLRITLRLQSRVFSVQWGKKNGVVVQCSGSRDYGASFRVRYVPRKDPGSNEEERFPPIKRPEEDGVRGVRFGASGADKGAVAKVVLSNKELRDSMDKWNPTKGRVVDSSFPGKRVFKSHEESSVNDGGVESSYWDHNAGNRIFKSHEESSVNDGGVESSYWEMEDETDHDQETQDDEFMKGPVELHLEKENFRKEEDVTCNGRTRKDAEEMAIKLLATRAYTAVDMKKKLHAKRFAHAIVDSVIDDFQKRGLINDSLYAETFSQSRWSSSSWGPRRIKQELLRKGVSRVNVDKAVKQVFEGDSDSSSDEGSRVGLSKDALDRLFVQASKQWLRSQGVPSETRKSRIIRWLQYRGFNWGVTSIILRRLESQESSEAR